MYRQNMNSQLPTEWQILIVNHLMRKTSAAIALDFFRKESFHKLQHLASSEFFYKDSY